MPPILRSVLAILGGMIGSAVLVLIVEGISSSLHPLPPGTDPTNQAAMIAYIRSLPPRAFVLVLVAWVLGALVGGWLAARISGRRPVLHGLIIGAMYLGAVVTNLSAYPHPLWCQVLGLGLVGPAACLGAWLGRPRRAPAVAAT